MRKRSTIARPNATHRQLLATPALAAVELLEDRRLFAAGAADPSFSGDGLASTSPAGGFDVIDMTVAGGRTIVLGRSTGAAAGGVVKGGANLVAYTAAGNLDTSFSGDGVRPIPRVKDPVAFSVQADGKILVAGTVDGVPGVARVLANGAADTSFQSTGFDSLPQLVSIYGVKAAPGGKVVVSGSSTARTGNEVATLIRLNANGTFDNTFSGDGIATVSDLHGGGIAVQADGKILLVGTESSVVITNAQEARVFRLTTAGELDPTYSGDGRFVQYLDEDGAAGPISLTPDGKLLIALRTDELSVGAIRLNAAGAVDLDLTGSGLTIDFGRFASATGVAQSPDGNYVYLAAQAQEGVYTNEPTTTVIHRYDVDGSYDRTFGDIGTYRATESVEIAIAADGKLVTAGNPAGPSAMTGDDDDRSTVLVRRRLSAPADADRMRLTPYGTLLVEGTQGKDAITVTKVGSNYQVKLNAITRTFAASAVTLLDVGGNGGDDTINTAGYGGGLLLVYGGAGNDTITTGVGNDVIYGGYGNDTIYAGGGNDRAYGDGGNDAISGDLGADRVYGQAGDDFVGGAGSASFATTPPIADYLDGGIGNDTGVSVDSKDATFSVETT